MKSSAILLITAFFSFALFPAQAAKPEEEARLVAAAKKAFTAHDAAGLIAITCWDRVPEKLKERCKKHYTRDAACTATDIKLIDPDPHCPDLDWTENGVTYHSNLPVIKQLKITFAQGSIFKDATYPVGEQDGTLFLLEPAPVK